LPCPLFSSSLCSTTAFKQGERTRRLTREHDQSTIKVRVCVGVHRRESYA
jgi:hypothetical protein